MRPNPEYIEYMIDKQRAKQKTNEDATPAFKKYIKQRKESLERVKGEVPPMKEYPDANK